MLLMVVDCEGYTIKVRAAPSGIMNDTVDAGLVNKDT